MEEQDKTRLSYLVDAIVASPQQWLKLMDICADTGIQPGDFKECVEELKDSLTISISVGRHSSDELLAQLDNAVRHLLGKDRHVHPRAVIAGHTLARAVNNACPRRDDL